MWQLGLSLLLEPPEEIDYFADDVNKEELSNQEHWPRPLS
jgi:hypothetical protein